MKIIKVDIDNVRVHSGVHGMYFKLPNKKIGVKLVHREILYDTYNSLREALRDARKEFNCLKIAYKKLSNSVPKPISLVKIKFYRCGEFSGYGYGYSMHHICGKNLIALKLSKTQRQSIAQRLFVRMAGRGIYHHDLHGANVIKCNKKYYALDFDPRYVTFKYKAAKYE